MTYVGGGGVEVGLLSAAAGTPTPLHAVHAVWQQAGAHLEVQLQVLVKMVSRQQATSLSHLEAPLPVPCRPPPSPPPHEPLSM